MQVKQLSDTLNHNHSQENQSQSILSSSPKTKVIRKCNPRKKTTKFIHNVVVHYKMPNGTEGIISHQKIHQTNQENQTKIQQMTQKSFQQYNDAIIKQHYRELPAKNENQNEMLQNYTPIYAYEDFINCIQYQQLMNLQF